MSTSDMPSGPSAPRDGALVLPVQFTRSVAAIWSGRLLIAGGTLAAIIAATLVAFLLPKTYESGVPLILLPTPIKQSGDAVSALIPRVLSVTDYEILLTSDGTLKEVADKIKQLGTWPEHDLRALDEISQLRRRMMVQLEITEKTAYGVARSPVILLKSRAGSPEQARELAQAWAQVAENLANSLYKKGKTGLKDFIETRFTDAQGELLDVRGKIRDLEIIFNDELEHERMAKKHTRLLNYEEKAVDLGMQIETTKKELEELRAQLEQEPQKLTLWKSPPMTAVFLQEQLKSGAGATSLEAGKQPGYSDEVLNETHIFLNQKITVKESELAGMQQHHRMLLESMEQLDKELQALREEIANRAFERRQLDLQETPLKQSYDLLANKVEQAKIAESEEAEMSDIKIVSDAVVPDRKISPKRSLIMLFGAMAGFMLSVFAVWIRALAAEIL